MPGSAKMPTRFRLLTDTEWAIVTRVFTADKLPYRWRVVITDVDGRRASFARRRSVPDWPAVPVAP